MAAPIKRAISKNITFPKTNIRVQEDRRTHKYHLVHGVLTVAKWENGTKMDNFTQSLGYEAKVHDRILELYKRYGKHEPRTKETHKIELLIPENA